MCLGEPRSNKEVDRMRENQILRKQQSYLVSRCISRSAEIQIGANQGNEDKNELHLNNAQIDAATDTE